MRYYPAVPIYFRNAAKNSSVQLGEHQIPEDTLLLISNWHLHKFSEHWGDPDQFRPDRWGNGLAEANPVGSDYFFPFGRGPRMCIGWEFAIAYMKLALATILLDTRVEMDPDQPYKKKFFFGVMMPKLRAGFTAA
jgi:cytochrome P450